MIDVNLRGVLHGIAAALPVMQQQGHGYFINVSSTAGRAVSTAAVYSATKCAVIAISEALRQEHDTMRVTIISPGATSRSSRTASPTRVARRDERVSPGGDAARGHPPASHRHRSVSRLYSSWLLACSDFWAGWSYPARGSDCSASHRILIGVKKFFERSEIEGEGREAAGDSASAWSASRRSRLRTAATTSASIRRSLPVAAWRVCWSCSVCSICSWAMVLLRLRHDTPPACSARARPL